MRQNVDRRQFVKNVGFGTLAVMAADFADPSNLATAQIAPGDGKSKAPRLYSSCCAWSYHEDLARGAMTMEDFIRKAVELRLDAVDLTTYFFKSTDPEYLHNLRHLAYQHAVGFSGVACGGTSSMVQSDAAKRAQSVQEIKKWIDVTDQLGASHLRIFAGKLPQGVTTQECIGWVVESMKAACDYSGQKGITLGLEDHGGVTQNSDVCLEIIHRVNSPYAGINLDITNFIPTSAQDRYAPIEACIPYATNIHMRDRFMDRTPVDMDRVWKIFAQAGHQGFISAEYERSSPDGEPATTGVPRLVNEIRKLNRKYSTA